MRSDGTNGGNRVGGNGAGGPQPAVPLPDGVAGASANAELAAMLESVSVKRVPGYDTVEFMKAAYRLATHYQGMFLQALLETGLRLPGPDDQIHRTDSPGEFAAEEARAALVWSRTRAEGAFGRAYQMFGQNPQIGQALLDAAIDEPRAKALCDWTAGLSGEHTRRIIDELLPAAGKSTVAELIDRIKRMAIALDPGWAERRYRDTVRQRRIELHQTPEGAANLSGRDLPADRAKTGADRINALAKASKTAGDKRRIDTIRADLFLGMLDGQLTGLTDQQIIDHILANPIADDLTETDGEPPAGDNDSGNNSRAADDDSAGSDNNGAGGPSDPPDSSDGNDSDDDHHGGSGSGGSGGSGGSDSGGSDSGGSDSGGSDSGGSDSGPSRPSGAGGDGASPNRPSRDDSNASGQHQPAHDHADRSADRAKPGHGPSQAGGDGADGGVEVGERIASTWNVAELRAELSTLLGLDQHPAELPGLGYLPASVARDLAARMGSAEWRFVICTPDGTPICSGITTCRPVGQQDVLRDRKRGGILELQLTTVQLARLATAATHGEHTDWQPVISDIHDRYRRGILDHQTRTTPQPTDTDPDADHDESDARRRRARAGLRRWIEIRDRYCLHLACRMPAGQCDQDHRLDYATGGLTVEINLDCWCRYDHRLQHDGGWIVIRPPGSDPLTGPIILISPLGHRHESRPPPVMQTYPEPGDYYPDWEDLPAWFTDTGEEIEATQQTPKSVAPATDDDRGHDRVVRAASSYPAAPPF